MKLSSEISRNASRIISIDSNQILDQVKNPEKLEELLSEYYRGARISNVAFQTFLQKFISKNERTNLELLDSFELDKECISPGSYSSRKFPGINALGERYYNLILTYSGKEVMETTPLACCSFGPVDSGPGIIITQLQGLTAYINGPCQEEAKKLFWKVPAWRDFFVQYVCDEAKFSGISDVFIQSAKNNPWLIQTYEKCSKAFPGISYDDFQTLSDDDFFGFVSTPLAHNCGSFTRHDIHLTPERAIKAYDNVALRNGFELEKSSGNFLRQL